MVKEIYPKHRFVYNKTMIATYHANRGDGLPLHSHSYEHLTMCHAGSCKVTQEDKSIVLDKYSLPLNLLANKKHEIEALEDGTVFVNIYETIENE